MRGKLHLRPGYGLEDLAAAVPGSKVSVQMGGKNRRIGSSGTSFFDWHGHPEWAISSPEVARHLDEATPVWVPGASLGNASYGEFDVLAVAAGRPTLWKADRAKGQKAMTAFVLIARRAA